MLVDIIVWSLLHLLGSSIGEDSPTTEYGTHKYVEYTPGNINLIISVPHDGFIHAATIPNRTDGCRDKHRDEGGVCEYPVREDCPSKGPRTDDWYCRAVTYADAFTQDIAKSFMREFEKMTGRRPYIILDNLHRSKMDPNREISRAAQGNQEAETAYNEFHNFILEARAEVQKDGPGLLVDLHGMTHTHEKLEIGYLYKPKDLNAGDYTKDVSSMAALMARTGMSPTELLAGEHSLGALFEREGYLAIPSPRQPVPGEDKYYRGGWITQIHGSRDGGDVDALQIEQPRAIREAELEEREEYTRKLAKVIAEYHQRYYTL